MSAHDPTGVVHIVGAVIDIGTRTRQCCAWCGTVLLDYDLARIAVPLGQDATAPAHFPPGALLEVDGNCKAVLDGDRLPDNACVNNTEAETKRPGPRARLLPGGSPAGRDAVQVVEALRQAALADPQPGNQTVLATALRCLGFPLDELGRTIANVRTSISDAGTYFFEDKIRFRIEGDLVHAEEGDQT